MYLRQAKCVFSDERVARLLGNQLFDEFSGRCALLDGLRGVRVRFDMHVSVDERPLVVAIG